MRVARPDRTHKNAAARRQIKTRIGCLQRRDLLEAGWTTGMSALQLKFPPPDPPLPVGTRPVHLFLGLANTAVGEGATTCATHPAEIWHQHRSWPFRKQSSLLTCICDSVAWPEEHDSLDGPH